MVKDTKLVVPKVNKKELRKALKEVNVMLKPYVNLPPIVQKIDLNIGFLYCYHKTDITIHYRYATEKPARWLPLDYTYGEEELIGFLNFHLECSTDKLLKVTRFFHDGYILVFSNNRHIIKFIEGGWTEITGIKDLYECVYTCFEGGAGEIRLVSRGLSPSTSLWIPITGQFLTNLKAQKGTFIKFPDDIHVEKQIHELEQLARMFTRMSSKRDCMPDDNIKCILKEIESLPCDRVTLILSDFRKNLLNLLKHKSDCMLYDRVTLILSDFKNKVLTFIGKFVKN